MSKIIKGLTLVGMIVILCVEHITPLSAEETIEEPDNLYALSACLMDAESGRILFGKEEHVKRANASTTKIMTLIVTLEQADLNDMVTISDYAASQPDVQLNARADDQFMLGDLCYSLMLESHNDSAVAIAEHVAGSVEAFAELMNEKAKQIGCKDTCFLTPNGLDKEDGSKVHGTSAADLARILSYCIMESPKREEFLHITQTQDYTFSNRDNTQSFTCRNHNAFLGMMEGALTGKTGFTGNAGYCYVGALQQGERTFVVALLGCGWPNNKSYKWSDTRKLMQYGLDYYERKALDTVELPDNLMQDIVVMEAKTDGIGEVARTPVVLSRQKEDTPEAVLLRQDEEIEVTVMREETLTAPVEAHSVVGKIIYSIDGEEILRTDQLVVNEKIPAIDFRWNLWQVCRYFLM